MYNFFESVQLSLSLRILFLKRRIRDLIAGRIRDSTKNPVINVMRLQTRFCSTGRRHKDSSRQGTLSHFGPLNNLGNQICRYCSELSKAVRLASLLLSWATQITNCIILKISALMLSYSTNRLNLRVPQSLNLDSFRIFLIVHEKSVRSHAFWVSISRFQSVSLRVDILITDATGPPVRFWPFF
jgi:hypothetical protein